MKKMYVLVRKDLSKSQQAVQGGHAVAEYLLNVQNHDWKNGTLVYLAVRNETDLISWEGILNNKNIDYAVFKEPDIGNQLTALSVVSDGELFKREILL